MDNLVDYLKELDLSDIEAKLYLRLLQTGPVSVRDLAQTIDIKRTTAYFYIDQLVEKGLVLRLVQGPKKLVAANEPENLSTLIDNKLKKAEAVKRNFSDILNLLKNSLPHENNAVQAEIKNYKGKNGVKKTYQEALKSKELRSLVNIDEVLSAFPENSDLFDEAVTINPGMKMFEIVVESPEAHRRMEQATGRTKNYYFKFLPENIKIKSTDILIYDGNISFINTKNQINSITLSNTDLYNNFILLFDFIWQTLPDPKK